MLSMRSCIIFKVHATLHLMDLDIIISRENISIITGRKVETYIFEGLMGDKVIKLVVKSCFMMISYRSMKCLKFHNYYSKLKI